jgi:hypothetical protein
MYERCIIVELRQETDCGILRAKRRPPSLIGGGLMGSFQIPEPDVQVSVPSAIPTSTRRSETDLLGLGPIVRADALNKTQMRQSNASFQKIGKGHAVLITSRVVPPRIGPRSN